MALNQSDIDWLESRNFLRTRKHGAAPEVWRWADPNVCRYAEPIPDELGFSATDNEDLIDRDEVVVAARCNGQFFFQHKGPDAAAAFARLRDVMIKAGEAPAGAILDAIITRPAA